ncbi:MAG: TatD family hydrolase [Bacteroidaceae bacterium]|nr:TatD family hydrolase [Bacteroidaceae bacterium]
MTNILDIHTHTLPLRLSEAIISFQPFNFVPSSCDYCSVGIHPWYLTVDNSRSLCENLEILACHPQVVAIGEAGVDKLALAPLPLQWQVFAWQANLSARLHLPFVIHAVHSGSEIILFKKQLNPKNPWIIHGFRGKKEQALQYLRHGFYLSFGERYNEEAFRAVPFHNLFLETDESKVKIECLYQRAAKLRDISVKELIGIVQQNINNVFFSH